MISIEVEMYYSFKSLSFFTVNFFLFFAVMLIPIKWLLREKLSNWLLISSTIVMYIFFLCYEFFLAKLFLNTFVIVSYQIYFGVILIFSFFNFFILGKNHKFQVELIFLGLFVSIWTTFCQFAAVIAFENGVSSSFLFFQVMMGLSIPFFILIHHSWLNKRTYSAFFLIGTAVLYFLYFFFIVVINIMTISFVEKQLVLNLSNHFIGRSLIESITRNTNLYIGNYDAKVQRILLFFFFAIFPIVYLIRMLVKEDLDRAVIEQQQKRELELKSYVGMIESFNQDLRMLHHDINNVLSTLEFHVYQDQVNIAALRSYFEEIRKNFGIKNLTQLPSGKLEYFHDPEVLGLILAKILKAKELHVDLKIEIAECLSFPAKNKLDTVRILGILIDNALEETMNLAAGNVQLAFLLIDNKKVLIQIENKTSNKNFFRDYIAGKVLSTKDESRGLGLQIIKQLLRKNKNLGLDCRQIDNTVQFSLSVTYENKYLSKRNLNENK